MNDHIPSGLGAVDRVDSGAGSDSVHQAGAVQSEASTAHMPMVIAAGRALCNRAAQDCGIDAGDNWKFYGEDFKADAAEALKAAGAMELLGHLRFAVKLLGGMPAIGATAQIAAMRAAVEKAGGKTA